MTSRGTTQFNEPARVWPCLLIYSLIFQPGKAQGVRSIKDIRGRARLIRLRSRSRSRQAIVLDLWSVIHCQPPKLTLLRISRCRSRSRHCPASHSPHSSLYPDILTNNFIDAQLSNLAVCVWFLIVAQLRWTHVIIAHFMTHLSKYVSRSRPWHCPLFAHPSQLLILRIVQSLCLTQR